MRSYRTHRKRKVIELMERLQAVRRGMAFGAVGSGAARITPAQWSALILVGERKACGVKDIAEALRITSSAATQLVNGLVRGGHLVRKESKEDGRAVALSLSPRTKARLRTMRSAALKRTLELLEALSDRELGHYLALTTKILDHALQNQP